MSKHTVPPDALVVVADGAKAILLRNTGTGSELALKKEGRITPKSLSAEGGQGPSGSRPGDQTVHQTEEATFAKQLADALYAMRHKGDYKQVVLIAQLGLLGQQPAAFRSPGPIDGPRRPASTRSVTFGPPSNGGRMWSLCRRTVVREGPMPDGQDAAKPVQFRAVTASKLREAGDDCRRHAVGWWVPTGAVVSVVAPSVS